MSMSAPRPGRKYTYGDYLKWPDEERWEIIDGVPYEMSPAPSTEHQRVSTQLLGQLIPFAANKPVTFSMPRLTCACPGEMKRMKK